MEQSTLRGEQGEVKAKRRAGAWGYGLADHAKDFGFYSRCDGKPLEGFGGEVI